MAVDLQPQAALESAVVDALRASLKISDRDCGRVVLKGLPPPRMGPKYVAVWGGGGKKPGSSMALDQILSVMVTVTVRLTQPYDRAHVHRDELELLCNQVVNAVSVDRNTFAISTAANAYAGFRASGSPDSVSDAGFCEPLVWQGTDDTIMAGPDWFHGHIEKGDMDCGLYQTVRFSGARLIKDYSNV